MDETWVHDIFDEALGVEVTPMDSRLPDGTAWQVGVVAMEFVRTEPLEGVLRGELAEALEGVAGVTEVEEEDREVWTVEGGADASALGEAALVVLRRHETAVRACLAALDD